MTTPSSPISDKDLRKAWLKRKFVSFEYHEELLAVHRQWLNVMRKALVRAEQDESPNQPDSGYKTIREEADHFRTRFMPMLECNDDVGKYRKDEWHKCYATATFRSIPDYGRYLRSEGDFLSWMTDAERTDLSTFWGPMAQMAENIQYTVDGNWDAHADNQFWILDEEFTGPITWPANWRDEVPAADLTRPPKVQGGQVCTHEGWWFTPAGDNSRRYFKQGEVMSDLQSDYGLTFWQWDDHQA
jgi:hypothetical protein